MWLLTRLIFHPLKPKNIAGIKIQGIIPAGQLAIAEKAGRMVNEEFFSLSLLEEKVTDPENFERLKPEIEMHIDHFLREKLKETFPMLSMLMGDKTINQLKSAFMTELESLFPVLMKNYVTQLQNSIDIEKMVATKIAAISMDNTAKMFYLTAKKQLLRLQVAAAVIGLIAGLLHLLVNTQVYH